MYGRKYDALFTYSNFRFYIGNNFPTTSLGNRTLAIIDTAPNAIYPR